MNEPFDPFKLLQPGEQLQVTRGPVRRAFLAGLFPGGVLPDDCVLIQLQLDKWMCWKVVNAATWDNAAISLWPHLLEHLRDKIAYQASREVANRG